jgi:RHS repeat-associated protein
VFFYHKDHLGSSTAMTDKDGAKKETTEYVPFGGVRDHTGIVVTSYRFTDQELDVETGLYNYDARLYDPLIGRFISPDSIVPNIYNPQYLNRYSYCLNNPLIYVDPSGHEAGDSDEEGKDDSWSWGDLWGDIVGFAKGIVDAVANALGISDLADSFQNEPGGTVVFDPNQQGQKGFDIAKEVDKAVKNEVVKSLLGNENQTPTNQGKSRSPKKGEPNSIYEQVDENGNVLSRTFYDENGNSFARQDFNHPHGGMQPHEHNRSFDSQGRPITKEITTTLPPGYDNKQTKK